MSHIFIGGSARCGKSTLSREIRRSVELQTVSGDALRATLRKVVPKGTFPVLEAPRAEKIPGEQEFIVHHTINAVSEIEAKRAQAEFVWPFVASYIKEIEHESGDRVLAESIDVWPDLISASGLAHKAAFLVDTSAESQANRIIASRDTDPYDWMHQNNYSDNRIRAWSEFNAQRSAVVKGMAADLGYLCIDLAETGFADGQLEARTYLLES